MKDLNFTGDEPEWAKWEVIDSSKPQSQDVEVLQKEIDRLKSVNRDISAEFEKTRQVLQLQHDLETDNLRLHKEDGERLAIQVKTLNSKLDEMTRICDKKNKEINELKRLLQQKVNPEQLQELI